MEKTEGVLKKNSGRPKNSGDNSPPPPRILMDPTKKQSAQQDKNRQQLSRPVTKQPAQITHYKRTLSWVLKGAGFEHKISTSSPPYTGTTGTTYQHVQAAHRRKPRPHPPGGSIPRQLQGARTNRIPRPAIYARNRADAGTADR